MKTICFLLIACLALSGCNDDPDTPTPVPDTDTAIITQNSFGVQVHYKYLPVIGLLTSDSIPVDTTYFDSLTVTGNRDTIKVELRQGRISSLGTLVYLKTSNDTAIYLQAYPENWKMCSFRYHRASQTVFYSFSMTLNHQGTWNYVAKSN